jgi:hypothetical protein
MTNKERIAAVSLLSQATNYLYLNLGEDSVLAKGLDALAEIINSEITEEND